MSTASAAPPPGFGRPSDLRGGRTAAIAFAVVILLTAASFALAQRLKREPTLVYGTRGVELFSPKLETGENRARFAFRLRKTDTITATVVTRAGDPVRTLFEDRLVRRRDGARPADLVRGSWNGAYDNGKLAPDGEYRVRIAMRDAGRAVVLGLVFTLDSTPPAPKLLSIGPEKTGASPRPELLPRADRKPINVRFRVAGRSRGISVIRTDLTRPRAVLDVPIPTEGAPAPTTPGSGATSAPVMNGADGTWTWDGTANGRRVPQGTYVVAVHAKDLVGNVGWSTGSADPVAPFGGRLQGRGGVTVRYLAAQSTQAAIPAGERAELGIISAGKQYDWEIRRVGEKRARSEGSSRKPLLRPKVPGGPSGLHVLDVRSGNRTAQATILTQGAKTQPILVVIPQASLTGSQLVDDDGDGAPDTLDRGVAVQTARVPVDSELPLDMRERIAPLLVALDRRDRRYDLTTDLALARGTGPQLQGHEGVVLAGTTAYLDAKVQRRLVTWVRRGGRLWVAEPGSLRRSVTTTASALTDPTQPSQLDPFGFELAPLQQVSQVEVAADRARLLRGTDGRFEGPLTVEPVLRIPTGAALLAEATTPGGGQAVLSAVRVERGAVVRTGISGLGANSLRDPDSREFVRRLWSFLRGG